MLLGAWVCLELTEPLWIMSMKGSLTTMKIVTACKKALHLREIERSHSRVASKRRHRSKVQGKKVGALHFLPPHSFAAHFHIHLPLKMERLLPVLFGEPVTLRILQKNLSHLHTKQCLLWLHVSFFNKKSSHMLDTTMPLVYPPTASCSTL